MIREVVMFTVACDAPGCEATTDDNTDWSCWTSSTIAWENAEYAGAREGGDWLLAPPAAWCPAHRPRCVKCETAWLSIEELSAGICEDCTEPSS